MHTDLGPELRMFLGSGTHEGSGDGGVRRSAFTGPELEYLLEERRLGRIATAGKDGTPHIAPVGFSYNPDYDSIDVGGHSLERTKKFRDVSRTGKAAIVIDDVLPPWRPRGIEVRGRAEVVRGPRPLIRIFPARIVSWGIESQAMGERNARTVGAGSQF